MNRGLPKGRPLLSAPGEIESLCLAINDFRIRLGCSFRPLEQTQLAWVPGFCRASKVPRRLFSNCQGRRSRLGFLGKEHSQGMGIRGAGRSAQQLRCRHRFLCDCGADYNLRWRQSQPTLCFCREYWALPNRLGRVQDQQRQALLSCPNTTTRCRWRT